MSEIKLIILQYEPTLKDFISLGYFEYNHITYPTGCIVPRSVVDQLRREMKEGEKR